MCCCIHTNCLPPPMVGWLECHHCCHHLWFLGQWSSRCWWFRLTTVDFWGPSTLGLLSPRWEWPHSLCCGSKLCSLRSIGLHQRGGCWQVHEDGEPCVCYLSQLPLPAWRRPDNLRSCGRSWWVDMCCRIHTHCLLPPLVGWLECHQCCHHLWFLGQWSSRHW